MDICNEYSCGVADKIFIYISYKGLLFPFHFYCIKNKLFHAGNLNESEATVNFDISTDCQRQVATIIKDDTRKIKSVCDKYNQPMPTEMRLIYEPKIKNFRAEYKIDGEGVCLIDKLVLSKEKLFLVDTSNNIFVLKETKLDIICTEIAKNMIESAGIKDVRFTELPVE